MNDVFKEILAENAFDEISYASFMNSDDMCEENWWERLFSFLDVINEDRVRFTLFSSGRSLYIKKQSWRECFWGLSDRFLDERRLILDCGDTLRIQAFFDFNIMVIGFKDSEYVDLFKEFFLGKIYGDPYVALDVVLMGRSGWGCLNFQQKFLSGYLPLCSSGIKASKRYEIICVESEVDFIENLKSSGFIQADFFLPSGVVVSELSSQSFRYYFRLVKVGEKNIESGSYIHGFGLSYSIRFVGLEHD